MSVSTSGILFIVLIISLIVYLIIMWHMFRNNTGVFSPYVTKPPENSCRPLIGVRKLTNEEKARLKALYDNTINGSGQQLPVCQ